MEATIRRRFLLWGRGVERDRGFIVSFLYNIEDETTRTPYTASWDRQCMLFKL
jgi:hypothetical protein